MKTGETNMKRQTRGAFPSKLQRELSDLQIAGWIYGEYGKDGLPFADAPQPLRKILMRYLNDQSWKDTPLSFPAWCRARLKAIERKQEELAQTSHESECCQ